MEAIDLAELKSALLADLAARSRPDADRLLPDSSLDAAHDNAREIDRHLSDLQAFMGDLANGGIGTPLRAQRRFKGNSYDLWVNVALELSLIHI